MRLVSFGKAGAERPGVVFDDAYIVDLTLASNGEIRTIRQLLQQGEGGMERVRGWLSNGPKQEWNHPVQGTRLGPPVTNPSKIVCLGLNYHCHASEQNAKLPARPLLFTKPSTALVGNGDPICYPAGEEHFDYEVEFAIVIGKTAFRVDPDHWENYVAGYTLVNDVSSRDTQFADRQWFRGKSADGSCPMGPYLVTRDEIPDPHNLQLTATLNGELRQDGNTSDLIFSLPEIIESVSENMTLVPGDVISTGTPAGVGIFCKPPACMGIGDEIAVSLQKVGTLTNRIRERTQSTPSPYPHDGVR